MYNLHIVIVRSLELWSERQFRVFAQLLVYSSAIKVNKKLCYRRRTARRAMSQNLVNCRNKLYDKYTINRMELEGYS